MFDIKRLLQYEFFPTELPPCFTSSDLATHAKEAVNLTNNVRQDYSIPLTYSGYKSQSARRKFAVPNPYHYCKAADFLVKNESDFQKIFEKSSYSLTAPTKHAPQQSQPYARRSSTVADTRRVIELLYQNNRYEIRLDINSFFDSIYTHSLPWAIHGRAQAKRERNNKNLLGNRLDVLVRAMNYNQTNGILVGNAISRIVSEVLLCTVDSSIKARFPNLACCHFVDDYYIYTTDSSNIQEIISFLRAEFAKYELSFNENKLQINESPFLYEKPWVEQIKQYIHLQPDVFLSKLVMEYNVHKDIGIIKYGLRIISQCRYTKEDWPQMQSRLLNIWVCFPSLSDRILAILWQNMSLLKKSPLKKAIYSVMDESLRLNREQELVWAVWFAKVFDIQMSTEKIARVLKSSNDLAIIVTLDIIFTNGLKDSRVILEQRKRIREELDAANVDDSGKSNILMWTSRWLLAYEANRQKWLNFPDNPLEYARKNSFFKGLLEKDIKFYDPNFVYPKPTERTKNYEYATRSELYAAIQKLKELIAKRIGQTDQQKRLTLTEEENMLYEQFINDLEANEQIYR